MNPESLRILIIIHFTALCGLLLYGLHRLWLIACWHRERSRAASSSPPRIENFPAVTVQLPLYNERFVAARLIDAAAKLIWQRDKIEIQALDDSTDDTAAIVDEMTARLSKQGVNIKTIRRTGREGFKAGALKHGMTRAKGEFIAVFDADFLPQPDFLIRTMPYFSDTETGMVQAKWSFLNSGSSWLTGIQSLLLNPHFSIEHWVRFRRGLFFNFNGTAGVWRRKAVESAGGWQADTVTEDLDLSYRAQLAGWKFVYLDEVSVPSELPVTLSAFRSQQQRWAKGSIQTAKKILPRLIASPLPVKVKVEAAAHLLANICWLFGTIVILTLYSAILWRSGIGPYQLLRFDLPLFMGTSFAVLLYFFVHILRSGPRSSFLHLFLLTVFSIGMSPSLSLSVIKGVFSRGGFFERTPKFGVSNRQSLPLMSFLYRQQTLPYVFMNFLFFIYTLLPVVFAYQKETWLAIPFLALFPSGFLLVILKDLFDMRHSYNDSNALS